MEQTLRTGRAMMSAATLMLLATIGCSKPPDMRDQRLADFAERSVEQQARQNQEFARQSQSVVEQSRQLAEASKALVAKDAESRREMVAAQHELNTQLNQQRAAIDAGRDALEQDRREIAEQRHRDPIIAESIRSVGLIIACLLPLFGCVLVLWRMGRNEPDDAAVAELLTFELVGDQPKLLPVPPLRPAIEHRDSGNSAAASNETSDS